MKLKSKKKIFLICCLIFASAVAYFMLLISVSFFEFKAVFPVLFQRKSVIHFRNPWILNSDGGKEESSRVIDFFAPKDAPEIHINAISGLRDLNFFAFWKYPQTAAVLKKALMQKNITAYPYKPDFLQNSDFIYAVFENQTNVPNDRYITKELKYTVNFKENGEIEAFLWINLFHRGQDMLPFSSAYKGELTIFVPIESVVLDKTADSEETQISSHVFKKFIELNPGQNTALAFRYLLPRKFKENNQYKLVIFKQPALEMKYQISARTNEDFIFSSSDFDVREFFASNSGILDADKSFSLKLEPTSSLFILNSADFLPGTGEIKLAFNRVPEKSSAEDGLNYTIEDTNKIASEITNQVAVTRIKQEGKNVFLKIHRASRKSEIYRLKLKNLTDRNKNKLQIEEIEIEI